MPSKLQFYTQMADHTAKQVTGSFGEWTVFLETMGRLYKYPFHEQLMIFAQKPNATACADYDLWNKQMGRYVRRGTKGIALIDTSGDNPRLKYVFDVSDTGGRENSRRLNLWEYKDEHQDAVTAALENRFGVSGEKGLADQLEQIASKLVTEYWNDNRRDILGILADSFLEEYDDYNVEVAFRNAATVSTTYALMSRCGLNPGDYFEHEDFLSVFDFNTRDTIAVLGSAVSNSSEQILRQVAIAVKNHEREASLQTQAERTENYGEQFELHEERGLSDSQSDIIRDRDEAVGQVRSDEEEVFAGTQTSAVEHDDSVGDFIPASEGDRRDSESENGTVDARTNEAEWRNGGTEGERPDDVGRLDEQPQKPSRGNNSRRTDSSITGQLNLFDVGLFPSEQEQIAFIDEAESVKPTPFAFSFAQEDIDDVLRLASNSEDTRMNVAAAFQKQKPMEEIVSLLKKEYHGGAGMKSERGELSVWYAEDGIHLAKGRTARYSKSAQVISWESAAERIGQLMDEGKYATNVELAEAALVDAFKDVKGLDPVPVGTYRGFKMSLTLEDFGRDYVLTLKGQMTHRVTLGKDPRGNLTRIDNALNGMSDRLATVQSKLESLYSQMETAKQELGKPFPQEDELRVKSARLAELNIALNIDDKTPLEAMAEETPTRNEVAKSARPSVLQKLHSYEKSSRTETTKKHKEEVL